MCGRFTLRTPQNKIVTQFAAATTAELFPRYNIAPSQDVPVVGLDGGERQLSRLRWGLIPFWAEDEKIGYRMINARAESVAEKPSFRSAFEKRRCLVIADGYYEWQKVPGQKTKQPYYLRMVDSRPFAFAGLWEKTLEQRGRPHRELHHHHHRRQRTLGSHPRSYAGDS